MASISRSILEKANSDHSRANVRHQDRSRAQTTVWSRTSNGERYVLSDTSTNALIKRVPPLENDVAKKDKTRASGLPTQLAGGKDTHNGHTESGNTASITDAMAPSKGNAANVDVTGSQQLQNTGTVAPAASMLPPTTKEVPLPSTPVVRLSLEDLIGDCDRVQQPDLKNDTPEEQIGWVPNSSSSALTPNRKRKRKRARSSSPSCPGSSSQFLRTPALGDFGHSSDEKLTPQMDPCADLWQRYAGGNQLTSSIKIPEFAQIVSASPRLLETPVKGAGLRRWASTGNDWPSSKNKRQCLNDRTVAATWQKRDISDGLAGTSKVAAMVQRIQQTLATQRLEQENLAEASHHASTSPTPITRDNSSVPLYHDLANKSPRIARNRSAQPQMATEASAAIPQNLRPRTNYRQHMAPINNAPLPAYKKPSISRLTMSATTVTLPAKPSPQDFDIFQDDAFDMTADELDELMTAPPADSVTREIPMTSKSSFATISTDSSRPQSGHKANEQVATGSVQNNDDEDDEFACDEIDEDTFVQAELPATQHSRTPPGRTKISQKRSTSTAIQESHSDRYQRYTVEQVVDGQGRSIDGKSCPEKVLRVRNTTASQMFAITLRGAWSSTVVNPGAVVHIVPVHTISAIKDPNPVMPVGQVVVSDDESSPLLIVHPDHMLSATTVADSFDCIRKAVLQDRIKATGETNKAMVYGKILHEIFQQALATNAWTATALAELVTQTLHAHVEGLWELGMRDLTLAQEEIRAKMAELEAWAGNFIAAEPRQSSTVDDKQGNRLHMSVSKLIAIEEHIWSPQYGLKGNIDATIEASIADAERGTNKKLIMPFEVKTGRTTHSPSHMAQTSLYTLLISDRYDVAVSAGILYYLESSAMSRIAPSIVEVRQMVQQRNRLASYIFQARNPSRDIEAEQEQNAEDATASQIVRSSYLPGLLRSPFKCGRCYAQQSCFTYHALVEDGTAQSAGMIDDGKKDHSMVWKETIGHLIAAGQSSEKTSRLRRWMTKWDRLLTFEESEQSRMRKELWTMSSKDREVVGRCFGNLVLTNDLSTQASPSTASIVDGIESSGGKINRFVYQFARSSMMNGSSFTENSQLTVGEPIVVSSEQGQWALANGYVTAIAQHEITVAVDRKLGPARQRLSSFDATNNQAFRGASLTETKARDTALDAQSMLYRIDKDEFSNGLALIRNNLVTLMSSHPIHSKVRDMIVFDAAPSFCSSATVPQLRPTQLESMNEDQQAAVEKVMTANDYALILGMPGTGKTTTIAHVIRALLADKKTILLTSFTHTAVDNILLKITSFVSPGTVLRLGVPTKINGEVQKFCQLAATPRKTIAEVEEAYMGTQIVATTCMGTNHPLFSRRMFDVCIVDEASQITLPTILGPLLKSRKFILVGDHYQLPPLVQNRAALEGGLDQSLFKQLSEAHPIAVAALSKQYRMCEDIMSLSNALIYSGRLQCGNTAVAKRSLKTDPTAESPSKFHTSVTLCRPKTPSCWLHRLTTPSRKVVFANTDPLGARALESLSAGSKNITNALEAVLTTQLALSLLATGVPATEIGIITLYRSQLTLIKQTFRAARLPREIEIDSADRFQGRDKECIILSLVRANEAGTVGDLLKDWRRVNVALTRARSKLIVLGSRQTIGKNDLMRKFLELCDGNGWAMDLPVNADEMHDFGIGLGSVDDLSTKQDTNLVSEDDTSRLGHNDVGSNDESARVLRPSQSAGNRNTKQGQDNSQKTRTFGPKLIDGRIGKHMNKRTREMKEQICFEIFEDLTGDEF